MIGEDQIKNEKVDDGNWNLWVTWMGQGLAALKEVRDQDLETGRQQGYISED